MWSPPSLCGSIGEVPRLNFESTRTTVFFWYDIYVHTGWKLRTESYLKSFESSFVHVC